MPNLLPWVIVLINPLAGLLTYFVSPTLYSRRKATVLLAWQQAGLWASFVLLLLTIFSFFIGWLEYLWEVSIENLWKKWEKSGKWYPKGLLGDYSNIVRPAVIEIWILSLAILNVIVLFFLVRRTPWFVLIPILTLTDVLHTLAYLLVSPGRPRNMARSLMLLIVRYLQIVTVFGSIYIFAQQLTDSCIFSVHGNPAQLTSEQAFYFSVVTATTVGFGDITPNVNALPSLYSWARPSTLVSAEVFCVLLIIGLEVPRIFTRSGDAGQKPTATNGRQEEVALTQQSETITTLNNQIEGLQDEVNLRTRHFLSTLVTQNKTLTAQNTSLQSELAETTKAIADLSDQIARVQNETGVLREQHDQLNKKISTLSEQNKALTEQNTHLQARIADATKATENQNG